MGHNPIGSTKMIGMYNESSPTSHCLSFHVEGHTQAEEEVVQSKVSICTLLQRLQPPPQPYPPLNTTVVNIKGTERMNSKSEQENEYNLGNITSNSSVAGEALVLQHISLDRERKRHSCPQRVRSL